MQTLQDFAIGDQVELTIRLHEYDMEDQLRNGHIRFGKSRLYVVISDAFRISLEHVLANPEDYRVRVTQKGGE